MGINGHVPGSKNLWIQSHDAHSLIIRNKILKMIESNHINLKESVLLGSNCSIGNNSSISHSTIGDYSIIGKNVVISNSIIMDHTIIEDGSAQILLNRWFRKDMPGTPVPRAYIDSTVPEMDFPAEIQQLLKKVFQNR